MVKINFINQTTGKIIPDVPIIGYLDNYFVFNCFIQIYFNVLVPVAQILVRTIYVPPCIPYGYQFTIYIYPVINSTYGLYKQRKIPREFISQDPDTVSSTAIGTEFPKLKQFIIQPVTRHPNVFTAPDNFFFLKYIRVKATQIEDIVPVELPLSVQGKNPVLIKIPVTQVDDALFHPGHVVFTACERKKNQDESRYP
jgi:hypothetical protein